ncbi:aspartyl protease [Xylona heveae TC161]|uniref:Probable aspartic-type endopeptidase OPSB n=1 Tax=Xylona heveae (strain CBS 132557 / TC161) TaxID=1328760 RepID=A0A165FRS2_XYLHT|nr:aspartyl protease [Xylona heveae TC161]KZF21298.1 aspartyl protease [Xylona heveae TC161]
MKGGSLVALAVGLCLIGTEAIQLIERDNPAVFGLDIQRRTVSNPAQRDRLRRRDTTTVSETLDNEETLYFANVSIGTPAQTLRLHIDTGSSDLWTNSAESSLCKSKGDQCAQSGTYNANHSTTYHYVSSDFQIQYADSSGAEGDYATDTLHIGGADVTDLQFGIGYVSSSAQGILGIGYPINEVQVNVAQQQPYPNLPQLLANKGMINSNAYSLWLNDLDSSEGAILFGGVNTAKYTGELSTVPVIKEDGFYQEFLIGLTGVSITESGKKTTLTASGTAVGVLLDSGSSLSYLPNDVTEEIYNAVGATEDQGVAFVPCSLAGNDTTIDYTFSSPTISVSMDELVLDAGTDDQGNPLTFKDGTPACLFGIAKADNSTLVLGDTFIRSAYIVYDLTNNEISLAQTKFNTTDNNIQEISNSTGVPGATKVTGAVTSVAVQTGGARIGNPTGSGTISGPTATATHKSGAESTRVPLALAAGFVAAGLALAV